MKNWTEDYFLTKIDAKVPLTEEELRKVCWLYTEEEKEGDSGRWTTAMTSYIKLKDRYFEIEWEQGLTELQDCLFYNQPIEVKKVEYDIEVPKRIIPKHTVHRVIWKKGDV